MNYKRMISLLLAAVLLLGCLTACSKGSETQEKQEQTAKPSEDSSVLVKPKYAYRANYLPVTTADGGALEYIRSYCITGDTLFYVGDYISGKEILKDEITGEPVIDETTGEPIEYEDYKTGLFRMELTSGKVSQLEGYAPREIP